MPKKNVNQNNPDSSKGERITGRKASSERYIPFYEFLLFDPKYRELSDKAKILYTFLRNKSIYFERKTEEFETDGEGTRSYRDDQGDIFIIADNTELSIILQCHINRVPTYKKELAKFGLLDEVRQFRSTNRIYVLIPQDITDRWLYIEEMKEKRAVESEKNKLKKEKYSNKPLSKVEKLKKEENPKSQPLEPHKNSQNVSSYNSQNVSSNNSQNVSQIYFKSIKRTLKVSKSTLNNYLSINKSDITVDISKVDLPISVKKVLNSKIDRLIKYNLDVFEIELHYNSIKEWVTDAEYSYVLQSLLNKMTIKPKSFSAVMNNWINRNKEIIKNQDQAAPVPIRKELVPDWLKKQIEQEAKDLPQTQNEESTQEKKEAFEKRVQRLQERLADKYGKEKTV